MMNQSALNLVQSIAEHTLKARAIRAQIRQTRGSARASYWIEKRDLGGWTRALLVELAFHRGIPYRHVEPVTARDKLPDHARKALIASQVASYPSLDAAAFRAWLETPETPERRAWREARIAKGAERTAARRVLLAEQHALAASTAGRSRDLLARGAA